MNTKNLNYDNKLKIRKGHNWRLFAIKRWKVLLNVVLFVLNIERSVNLKKKQTIIINHEHLMTT